MPKTTPTRKRLRSFTLDEISMVDSPAQKGATFRLLKREEPMKITKAALEPVLKSYYGYLDPYTSGAKSFTEIFEHCRQEKEASEVMQAIWPVLSALDTSLRSIAADKDKDITTKQSLMSAAVMEFLAKMKETWPEVEEEVAEMVTKHFGEVITKWSAEGRSTAGDPAMADKTPAELQKALDEMTTKLDALTKASEADKAALTKAQADLAAALKKAEMDDEEKKFYDSLAEDEKPKFMEMDKDGRRKAMTKRHEGDESFEDSGVTIRKSEVGPTVFALLKANATKTAALQKAVQDANDRAETATFAKRAESELNNLPGTVEEHSAVLKAISKMDDAPRKTLEAILKAANETAGAGFNKVGLRLVKQADRQAGAGLSKRDVFMQKVAEIQARDKCAGTVAMQKAEKEHAELFQEMQEEGAAA